MRPLEVQRAFGRGGQVAAGEARQLDLAVAVEGAAGRAQPEQLAHGRRAELFQLAFKLTRRLVLGGGRSVVRAGTVDASAEQPGVDSSDLDRKSVVQGK